MELRQLQDAVSALRQERPELWRTSAMTVAEAEVQRAAADLRRADQLAGIGRSRALVSTH